MGNNKYYLNFNVNKNVNIIFIGSTSYKGKETICYIIPLRPLYIIYIRVPKKIQKYKYKSKIFHPRRFKSKLINNFSNKGKFQNINLVANDLLRKI